MRTIIPFVSFLICLNTVTSQSGQYWILKVKNALVAQKHHRRATAKELFSHALDHNAACNRYWNDLNLNSDGVITTDELEQILPKLTEEEGYNLIEILQWMDSDGNDEVAEAEFVAGCSYTCEDLFDDLDTNGDHLLTVVDLEESLIELGWSAEEIDAELDGMSPGESLNVKEFCSEEMKRTTAAKKEKSNNAFRTKTEAQTVDCACSMEWDPVICDGVQFSNLGCAACSGYADHQCYPAEEEEEDLCVCTTLYDPVICNGEHFGNMGCAACSGYEEHECYPEAEPCACSYVWDPVICNGEQFSNMGCAACRGYEEHQCSPENDCVCSSEWAPVICNGEHFGNVGCAACSGYEEHECFSVAECICTSEHSPVFCNGEQFGNMCEAACNGYHRSDCSSSSECNCSTDDSKPVLCNAELFDSMCEAECNGYQEADCVPDCVCPDVYMPVYCNGEEFANWCEATCVNSLPENECIEWITADCACTLEWDPVTCDDGVFCDNYNFRNLGCAVCHGLADYQCNPDNWG